MKTARPPSRAYADLFTGHYTRWTDPVAGLRLVVQRIEDLLRSKGYTSVSHLVQFFASAPPSA